MKTLIKKDLRENLPLALIGLLVFLLLLANGYRQSMSMLDYLLFRDLAVQPHTLQPLLSNLLLLNAALFCGLFGAVLGWMQTRNEAHRDLWAFLVHRPVTRNDIFLAKTAAGLVLYALSAGLPLAGLVVVVWLPGQVAAPFEWAMVLPLLEIFLAGGAGYFAGVLMGLRPARWYASRGLGAGWVVAALVGIFDCPHHYQSLALVGFALGVLALAVWGAYQTDGFYRDLPVAGKLALTAVMTAGCALTLVIAAGVISQFLSPTHFLQYANYQMLLDGTVCKIVAHDGEYDEMEDLDGHPLLDHKTGQKMKYKETQPQFAYGSRIVTRFQREPVNPLQNDGSFFILWNVTDQTLWYLTRHGKLVGFDGRTRRQVGTLEAWGADGRSADPFLTRNCSGSDYYYYNRSGDVPRKFISTAKTIYQVDFKERTLRAVLTLTNDEVGGYDGQQYNYGQNESQSYLFTTRNSVYYLDHQGAVVFKVAYEPGFEKYPSVSLASLVNYHGGPKSHALWFYPDNDLNSKSGWKMPVRVKWIAPAGEITQSRELPALSQDTPKDWTDTLGETFMPPITSLVETGRRWSFEGGIHYPDWGWKGMPLAAICALIGWRQVRRHRFSGAATAGWTGFIFLFGMVGLMVLFCVQEWPARETCAKCQKLRAVDREACEHCGTPFPPAEKNGTEIFAALEKARGQVE